MTGDLQRQSCNKQDEYDDITYSDSHVDEAIRTRNESDSRVRHYHTAHYLPSATYEGLIGSRNFVASCCCLGLLLCWDARHCHAEWNSRYLDRRGINACGPDWMKFAGDLSWTSSRVRLATKSGGGFIDPGKIIPLGSNTLHAQLTVVLHCFCLLTLATCRETSTFQGQANHHLCLYCCAVLG